MPSVSHDQVPDVGAFLERMALEAPVPSLDAGHVIARARRRAALTILAAALVLGMVTIGSAAALDAFRSWDRSIPADRGPAPTVPQTKVQVVGRFRADDLEALVLRRGEQPAGWGLRFDSASRGSAITIGSSIYVPYDELQRAGFVESYYSLFFSRAWDTSMPGGKGTDLLSWAMLFESPEAAHEGFGVVSGPTEVRVRRWTSTPVRGLGDEATEGSGLVQGLQTTAYVWRVDNVVLFLASQGAIPLDELRSVAQLMDARAG